MSIPDGAPFICQAQEFAAAYGYERKMHYSIPQTSKFTGIPRDQLASEIRAGRLKTVKLNGSRWELLNVLEVDRWLTELARRS